VRKVLIVGAAPNSLGAAIADQVRGVGYQAITAGITTEEKWELNLTTSSANRIRSVLEKVQPTHIVCTAGINHPEDGSGALDALIWYQMHFLQNVAGPMRLLEQWQRVMESDGHYRHFVAISSNSAHVPRSGSAAYCASKAALSMALRVKAREGAGRGSEVLVYGYEPGLLAGTPMTADTVAQFGPAVPLTRMRDRRLAGGIPTDSLAYMVACNLGMGPEINGVMLRVDADES
jgi:NAD(P)-dependent dehydrogenase (short-subunit alcohol dehydrogenase family)